MVFRLSYKALRKYMDFPNGSRGKESTCNAEDTEGNGSVPGREDPLEKDTAAPSSVLV